MRGVVAPKSKEEASKFLDMLEDLLNDAKLLVARAVTATKAAASYTSPPPHDAATTRGLVKANRTSKEAQALAWQRVRFAERHVVDRLPGLATTPIFIQFAAEDLLMDTDAYTLMLQSLARRVYALRTTMEANCPEEHSPITYALSTGGPRKRHLDGPGTPGFDFDPVHLAWLADAPYGEGKVRRMHLQNVYGCGHSALEEACRSLRLERARVDDLYHGLDEEYRHRAIHYDDDGNELIVEDDDSIAEKILKVRGGNLNLGLYNMTKMLKSTWPNVYFSYYTISKILRERDFSRRVHWAPLLVREPGIWSPFPGFSYHLDGVSGHCLTHIIVHSSYSITTV